MKFSLSENKTSITSVFIGLIVVTGIVFYIGPSKVISQIGNLGWMGFSLIFLSLILTFLFWTVSWIVIMRAHGIKPPLGSSLGARISSFAVSYLTPSMHFGGEPVRAMLITKRSEASYTSAFATIATERITSALAMLTFIMLGAYEAIYIQLPSNALIYLILLTVLFFALLVLIIVNFVRGYFIFSKILAFLKRILPSFSLLDRAEEAVESLERDINSSFSEHLRHTVIAYFLNLIATFFMFIRPQIFFYYSKGELLTLPQISILFALISLLASFFWVTPGGLGIAEGGLIGIFAMIGASGSDAVAYSFSVKMVEFLFVGFGITWMAHFGIIEYLFKGREEQDEDESQEE